MYISIKAHMEYGIFKVVEVTKDNYIIDASGWEFPIPKSEAEVYNPPLENDKVIALFNALSDSYQTREDYLQEISYILDCDKCPCKKMCDEQEASHCHTVLEEYLTTP